MSKNVFQKKIEHILGKNNTLSEMNLIKDEVGNDHTAKNLPQHNTEHCKYSQKEIL